MMIAWSSMNCTSDAVACGREGCFIDHDGSYHHLNHYALFGGGYRDGAMSIMRKLHRKYGQDDGSLTRT
jgi:hypothetical protein